MSFCNVHFSSQLMMKLTRRSRGRLREAYGMHLTRCIEADRVVGR